VTLLGGRRAICAIVISAALSLPTIVAAEPEAHAIDATTRSATCGGVTVTWSVPKPTFTTDTQTATIHASDTAGNALFDLSQDVVGPETLGPVWCGDLLGDGRQALNYSMFSGGAHCCFSGSVVVLDGSGEHLLDWGLGSYGLLLPQQLDGSGPLAIPGVSPLFNYYDNLGFANSPTLPIVYAYDGTRYVEATAHFTGYLSVELANAESDLTRARPGNLEQEAAALKVYALHLLLGDGEKALASLESRVLPAVRSWLASHAAEVRSTMAQAYSLPGAPVVANKSAAAVAQPTIIPVPVVNTGDAAPPPGVPDTLTDPLRSDIVAAVQRANSAWSTATRTLDASVLNGNVAGGELSNDLAELNNLRSRGQTRNNVNVSFAVTGVSLDAPGLATVRTHETWYAEMYDSGGRLLQVTPTASYDEIYSLEFQNGLWIVTRNDL
jgi:hypothetical protein